MKTIRLHTALFCAGLIICFSIKVQSQNIHYFNNRYDITGNGSSDKGWSILETDRNFIIAGNSKDYSISNYWNFYIMMVDKNGIVNETKLIGDGLSDYVVGYPGCLIQYNDSTFYTVGFNRKYTSNWVHDRGMLTCYDNRMDTLWTSYYGEKTEPYDTAFLLYQLKKTADDNIVIVGGWKPQGEEIRIWMAKTDRFGNLLWENSFGTGEHYFSGYSIIQTSDGGYAIGAYVFDIGMNTSGDPLVIKTDSLGNEEWTVNLGGPYIDYIAMLCNSPDGHIVALTCYADSMYTPDVALRRIYISKLDNSGNLIWSKKYGESTYWNYSFNIRPAQNGDFLACGRVPSVFPHHSGWILRINNDGDSLWYRQYDHLLGDESINKIYDVMETQDHNIVGCGTVFPMPPDIGSQDTWIIRLDSIGCEYPFCDTTVGVDEIASVEKNGLLIYPNPASNIINCRFKACPEGSRGVGDFRLVIYDLFGRKAEEIVVPPWQETVRMDVSGWNTGVYIAVLWDEDGVVGREKFVVTKGWDKR